MTHLERLRTLSGASCCVCSHRMSMKELDEFRSVTDEHMHGVYCRLCMEQHLLLCSECSCRYTADGICEECVAREYALAG